MAVQAHTPMTDAVDHRDLLGTARSVRDAVECDDTDRLHAELTRLRTAVMHHVFAERSQLDSLPDAAAAVAVDGQRRLLRLLTDVLFGSVDCEEGQGCNCLVRAAEIEVAIGRQARLEIALIRRHA